MIGNPMANVLGNPLGNPLGLARAGADVSAIGTITTRTTGPAANEMEADGRQLLKAEFSKLYAVIGDAYSYADFSRPTVATQTAPEIPVNLGGLAYGNGVLIALGATSHSISKDKGFSWVAGTGLPSGNWVNIVFGGGLFLIINSAGDTATSTDGISWRVVRSNLPARSSYVAAHGRGRFVVLSSGHNLAYWSEDGRSFFSSTIGARTYSDIAYGKGIFLAISSGNVATMVSQDGASWSLGGVLPSTYPWSKVAYGNGVFIVVANTTSVASYCSIDGGLSWVASSGVTQATNLIFCHGYFIYLTSASQPVVMATLDGRAWANLISNSISLSGTRTVAVSDGVLVAIGGSSGSGFVVDLISDTYMNIPNIQTFGIPSAYIKVT